MEVNETLLELGDPIIVGKLIEALGISGDDFKIAGRGDQIKDLMDFLMTQPDPVHFVRRAIGAKQVDRVDFMSEYSEMHKNMAAEQQRLETINKELEAYDPEGEMVQAKVDSLYNDKVAVQQKMEDINQEIKFYEQ